MLNESDLLIEEFFLRLRTREGIVDIGKFISVSFYFGAIHLPSFKEKFWHWLEDYFAKEIDYVIENKYMEYKWEYLTLTHKGSKCYNGIISLFYAPAVKNYLLNLGK